MAQHFEFRVPATTANLGPGYGVVGLALDLWFDFALTVLPFWFRTETMAFQVVPRAWSSGTALAVFTANVLKSLMLVGPVPPPALALAYVSVLVTNTRRYWSPGFNSGG